MTQNAKCMEMIADLGLKCWENEELAWINSNLREIGEKPLKNCREFCSRISASDDFLFEMIIIWSFERVGFNDKVSRKSDVKTHAVSTLIGLKNLLSEMRCDTVQCLIKKDDVTNISNKWFQRFQLVQNKKYKERRFNPKFGADNLKSFLEFYQKQNASKLKLRDLVRQYKFRNAYYSLLTIKGIGDKVAKMIVRDLAFALTDLGKLSTIDCKKYDFYELSFAVPIDRWVRRYANICLRENENTGEKKKNNEDEEINIDECHLSIEISRTCCQKGVNPLFFDHGLYYLEQDTDNNDCQKIKEELKQKCERISSALHHT